MLELKKSVLELKIDGQVYTVKYPTLKAVKHFQEKTKDAGEASLDITLEFLASLGLPVNVSEELEPSHLQTIIETISGSKKN
jgi:hypothetical protein